MSGGRLRRAEQFFSAAETVLAAAAEEADVAEAFVTLCVHAGIAAADVICCAALGRHAIGDENQEATALLRQVSPRGTDLSNALATLLGMKTRAGYGSGAIGAGDRKRAHRAARKLLEDARLRRL